MLIALGGLCGSLTKNDLVYTSSPSTALNTLQNTTTTPLTTVENGKSKSSSLIWITSTITTTDSQGGQKEVAEVQKIVNNNYAGWKGTESLVKPYSSYMALFIGQGVTADFFWPFVSSENPLKELASRDDIAIVLATIERIVEVRRGGSMGQYAVVVYEIKIS